MRSKSTGNVISDIKITNSKVLITFTDLSSISVSKEAYTSMFLFEGKSISNKDIDNLKEITELDNLYSYALSLLESKYYTEKQIKTKLSKKTKTHSKINKVIAKLKTIKVLDDKKYAKLYVDDANNQGYGKYKIIKKLKELGIDENIINSIKFATNTEVSKANDLLPKLVKKYSKYNNAQKNIHIRKYLLSNGYDNSVIEDVCKNIIKASRDEELSKLRNDYQKYKNKLIKNYKMSDIKQKSYTYLLSKGYVSEDIRKIMEER